MADVQYCHEKFAAAVRVLAKHPGAIRERVGVALLEAARAPLDPLTGQSRELYEVLSNQWLAAAAEHPDGRGGIAHYVDSRSDDELVEDAETLLLLDYLTREVR